MDIEKELNPKTNTLQTSEDFAFADVFDAELDLLECRFNNDSCVEIDTNKYQHITLTLENLEVLKKLILKSEKFYKDCYT